MKQYRHESRTGRLIIPHRVRLAVLFAILFHGLFIVTARYRLSYDAYVHMFFGDHYAKEWWSLWDGRWYTGFYVSSYPPLVHQLIGLLSHIIGLEAAFAFLLWLTLILYPLAIYLFSHVFVGKTISGYASLGATFLPSLYLSAHIFGQLPFLFSTLLALFGAASLACYLKGGGAYHAALTIALTTTATASHHAALLVQPFLIFPVVLKNWLDLKTSTWALGRILFIRLCVFTASAIFFAVLVIFPFWQWGLAQTLQTPIDHASRHNFFADPLAPVLFFLPMYGPLIFIIPFAFTRNYHLTGLTTTFLLLFVIGLGDTTPLPRLLFGKGWAWLTYDRFAVWASLTFLPFLGIAVIKLRRKISAMRIFGALALTSLVVGFVTVFLPLQPAPLDMKPIVDFLNRDGYSQYRYLTFGFGDQLALLSTLTTATTMDGSYHTARNLPELRSSGIAQIDTVFWSVKGLSSLDPILQKAGERGVRWGFVNLPQYVPVLERNGWTRIGTLENGVQVWENPSAILPALLQPPLISPLASFAWGTFPLLSFVTTLFLALFKLHRIQREAIWNFTL